MKFGMAPKNRQEFEPTSRESLSAEKVVRAFEKVYGTQDTDKSEAFVTTFVESNKRLFLPGVSAEDVVKELKKKGFIADPVQEKKSKPAEGVVLFRAVQLKGTTIVEDEELKKRLEENNFFEALERDIFRNDADLKEVHEKSLRIGSKENRESFETDDYYYDFADLVRGGTDEIERDLKSLKERIESFRRDDEALDKNQLRNSERNKMTATIVERAVVYGVTDLGWCGEDVSVEPASLFDDIKHGVDDVLQVKREGESAFAGLGIDITYRGLLSAQYREKLFKLLRSVRDGYQERIKYFKNRDGEPMKEFLVPKIILSFNLKEVREMVHMVRNMDNPELVEGFKKSPQRMSVMRQMIVQCEIMAEFSQECRNPVFQKYDAVGRALREVFFEMGGTEEPEDEIAKHVKYLIEEFKLQDN